MEIEIPPVKEALLVLAEHIDELNKNGVKVKVTLDSEKFLEKIRLEGTKDVEEKIVDEDMSWWYDVEEERIAIVPDEQLIETLKKMWPLIAVGGTYHFRGGKGWWEKPYIIISTDFERAKVNCPFCGSEGEYLINYDSASSPSWCKMCGATVFAQFEPDFSEYGDRVTFHGDKAIIESGNSLTIALRVEEEDDIYLFFTKNKIRIEAEDVRKMVEGLLIKHAPIFSEVKYVIKRTKKIGTGKGIYTPVEWGDCEVLAIKLPESRIEEKTTNP